MRQILKCIALFLLVLQINVYCFANNDNSDLKALVTQFCSKEFQGLGGFQDVTNGDENAEPIPLFKCTSNMPKQLKADICDNMDSYLSWEPLFIVDSYNVGEVKKTDSRHAYAIVTFHQLARSVGSGDGPIDPGREVRKFIKDIRDITVKLSLEYDGKRWLIVDPPYPKVSYDVLLKYYSDEAADTYLYATGKKGTVDDAREKFRFEQVYDYQKSIVNFLVSLKK
jgi:hypothetical protein